MNIQERVRRRILERMKALRMRPSGLAEAVGKAPSWATNILRDRATKSVPLTTLQEIADALDTSVVALVAPFPDEEDARPSTRQDLVLFLAEGGLVRIFDQLTDEQVRQLVQAVVDMATANSGQVKKGAS